MDAEDRARTLSNKAKILAYLQRYGAATNQVLRGIGGARAMGRVHELQADGHAITVRKLKGALWEIRLNMTPMGRDAMTPIRQTTLFDLHQR